MQKRRSSVGRLGLAAVASVLGTLAFIVPVASAASETVSARCTVDGLATTSPGVKVSGGSGTYTFASGGGTTTLNFNCVVREEGTNNVDIETVSLNSSGNYSNISCGTGTVDSTATKGGTIQPVSSSGGNADLRDDWWKDSTTHTLTNQVDLSYHIGFTAGQGELQFTGSGDGAASGGGPIWIGATAGEQTNTGDPTTSQCTIHFQLHGFVSFSVTFNEIP